jgi:hypothetical protein
MRRLVGLLGWVIGLTQGQYFITIINIIFRAIHAHFNVQTSAMAHVSEPNSLLIYPVWFRQISKGKVVPMLNQVPYHEDAWGNGGIIHTFLIFALHGW